MIRELTTYVRINGIETPVRTIRTVHDVDQPIATGSLTMAAPRPNNVQLSAPVLVYAGWDGAALPIFNGRIADDNAAFSENGGILTVQLEGWSKLMWYENEAEVGFVGPMRFDTYWRSLCNWCGLPYYRADAVTSTLGVDLLVGNNPDIAGGWIPISTTTSPGADIDRQVRLYGYRVFDTPDGTTRLMRISGLPTKTYSEVVQFLEGENVLNIERAQTLAGVVNYWEMIGTKYTAADGSEKVIRSTPASYVSDTRFGPRGVSHKKLSDPAMQTVALADASRNAHEVDSSAPSYRWKWQATGDPVRTPGEQVATWSKTVNDPVLAAGIEFNLPQALWLMHVEHTIGDGGWTTSMEGWAGGGTPLPAGNDCAYQTLLGSTGKHLGNEYLSHYRRPNPDGSTVAIPFTVANDYTTLTIRGWGHGTNSFQGNTQSKVSRFEIWQGVDKKASGDLPRLNENLEQRLNYSLDSTWERLVIPLTGSLTAGSAELRIISETDRDVGDQDDFEVRDLQAEFCGVGQPTVIVIR